MADTQKPQPRKLIVCCDGTWNRRDAPGGAPTNVAKMARALRPYDDSGTSQLIYYHPGVGTGNRVDHFLGGAFGIGLSGNVQSEYAFLADNFQCQIFLFGFSRGAYTVRSLAGLIGLVGLMEKADMDYFPQVYKIYMSRKYRGALVRGQDPAATLLHGSAAGRSQPSASTLFETNVFRPPKLQHTVERRDSNGHLGRLPPFGPRAQRVTNHSLVAADRLLPRHANCNQMPAASPCGRARRSAAGAGRAWSARSLPWRLAPRSNVAAQ
jgi:hypothetical protein